MESENLSETACPNCGGNLTYGALLDTVTGQVGYGCDDCPYAYSSAELRDA